MSTKFLSPGWRMPRNANQSKQSNYSMNFDTANNSGIITSLETEIQGKTELSFSFWFYSNSTAACFLFDNETSNSYYRISLYYESATTTSLRLSNGSPQGKAIFTSPPINQWNYFVFTFDGSQSALELTKKRLLEENLSAHLNLCLPLVKRISYNINNLYEANVKLRRRKFILILSNSYA